MNIATQQGAIQNPDLSNAELEVRPNPRNVAIEAMTLRMETARTDDLNHAIQNDPGLADTQKRIDDQIEEANKEAEKAGLLVRDDQTTEGVASIEPMHTPAAPAAPAALPKDLENDPLAEYIVMQEGQPMFATKIDGQTKLIPLDQARRELQIGAAAATRMNEASAIKRHLEDRERTLLAGEAALAVRVENAQALPSAPTAPQAGLTDDDLLEEANDIFNTAFSGTEEEAAKKLAKTLGKIRNMVATSAQPTIDAQGIARQAANMAVGTIRADSQQEDVRKGYISFKENYPDVAADAMLYKTADNMTDEIARENPSWPISQVMDEAGRRTRAWVNNLQGIENTEIPASDPVDESINVVTDQSTQDSRNERKSQLVRMPKAANAAVHTDDQGELEQEQTPLEALNELKEVRGQPV